jgi:hypothetical protein
MEGKAPGRPHVLAGEFMDNGQRSLAWWMSRVKPCKMLAYRFVGRRRASRMYSLAQEHFRNSQISPNMANSANNTKSEEINVSIKRVRRSALARITPYAGVPSITLFRTRARR